MAKTHTRAIFSTIISLITGSIRDSSGSRYGLVAGYCEHGVVTVSLLRMTLPHGVS